MGLMINDFSAASRWYLYLKQDGLHRCEAG